MFNYGSWFLFSKIFSSQTEMQMYPTPYFNNSGGRIYLLLPKEEQKLKNYFNIN